MHLIGTWGYAGPNRSNSQPQSVARFPGGWNPGGNQAMEQAVDLAENTMSESGNVAGAAEEQAAELDEVSQRAQELTRYAQYLGDGLGNFETEEEHEFVFQSGSESAKSDAGDAEEPAE